ncbi:endonuclease/exonuclease/phosphatase family protein [Streptomyces sp. NPDC059096]|uniref:endonuclease/exonuclease/phosphatase family protein n=1 Tax=Streptomyces sp. NPDC059096 TaxID=3346727 RepID=UPI00369AE635
MSRYVTYNVFNGGIDADGSEHRRKEQIQILASLDPAPTVLVIQEATGWHRDGWRRLHELAYALGMVALHPVTSHIGDGENATALLYRPSTAKVIAYTPGVGIGKFHHGLLRARMEIDGRDVLVLGTHLSPANGAARLAEVGLWMSDYGGSFPGMPDNAVFMGDFNIQSIHDPEQDWATVPVNLHPRYRAVRSDGTLGEADRAAMRVLLDAGWTDPDDLMSTPRAATVGHWYKNEPTPLHLDHALIRGPGIRPTAYWTLDTKATRAASDHLPVILDTH